MVFDWHNHATNVSPVFLLGAVVASIIIAVTAARYLALATTTGSDFRSTQPAAAEVRSTNETGATLNADTSATPESAPNAPQAESAIPVVPSVEGTVTIDGQSYTVPENGEFHHESSDGNGQTRVDISVHSSGSGNTANSSSSSVRLHTSSSSTVVESEESP